MGLTWNDIPLAHRAKEAERRLRVLGGYNNDKQSVRQILQAERRNRRLDPQKSKRKYLVR